MRVRATRAFTYNFGGLVDHVEKGYVFSGDIALYLNTNGAPVEEVGDDVEDTIPESYQITASSNVGQYANPAVPEVGDGQEPAQQYKAAVADVVGKDSGTPDDESPPVDRAAIDGEKSAAAEPVTPKPAPHKRAAPKR